MIALTACGCRSILSFLVRIYLLCTLTMGGHRRESVPSGWNQTGLNGTGLKLLGNQTGLSPVWLEPDGTERDGTHAYWQPGGTQSRLLQSDGTQSHSVPLSLVRIVVSSCNMQGSKTWITKLGGVGHSALSETSSRCGSDAPSRVRAAPALAQTRLASGRNAPSSGTEYDWMATRPNSSKLVYDSMRLNGTEPDGTESRPIEPDGTEWDWDWDFFANGTGLNQTGLSQIRV